MSSTNHLNYPQDMNLSYGNMGTGPNQGRRIVPMHLPVTYPSQAPNGAQVTTSLQEGQRMAMNQRLQAARPKMVYTRQHYQAYIHPGHTPLHSNNQMSTQQYPYYAVPYMPTSSGQIVGEFPAVQNSSRGYPQGYVRRPMTIVRKQNEEKPTSLVCTSNPQLNTQPAVPCPSYVSEDDVEQVDAIYHYGVEGSDWICIRVSSSFFLFFFFQED